MPDLFPRPEAHRDHLIAIPGKGVASTRTYRITGRRYVVSELVLNQSKYDSFPLGYLIDSLPKTEPIPYDAKISIEPVKGSGSSLFFLTVEDSDEMRPGP